MNVLIAIVFITVVLSFGEVKGMPQLLFTLLEVVRRGKKIPREREGLIHFVGLLAMVALMLVVTVKDLHGVDF